MNKKYFGYVRISDDKQKKGVSPQVQRRDISAFAQGRDIDISEWFVEVQTAAKTGRAVFTKMLARLEKGEAEGVVFHKIDRSARNLDDWNNVGSSDRGIDVQFAHESLDLRTRRAPLSRYHGAVGRTISATEEEARKGFMAASSAGRLSASGPIGDLAWGRDSPKPLILSARHSSGGHSSAMPWGPLASKICSKKSGLAACASKPESRSRWAACRRCSTILFYTGLIYIRRTNVTFEGQAPAHRAEYLFDRVQAILTGKTVTRVFKHDFIYRRRITCIICTHHLIGETQKGHVYYRCHGDACGGTVLREEVVEDIVLKSLKLLVGMRG